MLLASHEQVFNEDALGAVSGTVMWLGTMVAEALCMETFRLAVSESYPVERKLHLPKYILKNTGPVGRD